MKADGFAWWVKRIKRALNLYDEFRIDHFRGLAGFWAVPCGEMIEVTSLELYFACIKLLTASICRI